MDCWKPAMVFSARWISELFKIVAFSRCNRCSCPISLDIVTLIIMDYCCIINRDMYKRLLFVLKFLLFWRESCLPYTRKLPFHNGFGVPLLFWVYMRENSTDSNGIDLSLGNLFAGFYYLFFGESRMDGCPIVLVSSSQYSTVSFYSFPEIAGEICKSVGRVNELRERDRIEERRGEERIKGESTRSWRRGDRMMNGSRNLRKNRIGWMACETNNGNLGERSPLFGEDQRIREGGRWYY